VGGIEGGGIGESREAVGFGRRGSLAHLAAAAAAGAGRRGEGAIGGRDGSAAACSLVATGAGLPAAGPLLSLVVVLVLTELVARGRVRACCW